MLKRSSSFLLVLFLLLSLCGVSQADAGAIDLVGEISDQTYVNEALGICAFFPDSWYLLKDDEIAETMEYPDWSGSREGVARLLDETKTACDMYAVALDGSSENINVMLEDLGTLKQMSEDSYYQAITSQLESTYAEMGAKLVSCTKEMIDFAGKARVSTLLEVDYSGIMIVQRCVLIKAGGYMATVSSTASSSERADAILQVFESYGEETLDVLGTSDSHRYSNLFLGIEAEFDDGWYILSREETAQTMGAAAGYVSDEDVAKILEESGTTTDLYAMALNNSGDNVNIQLHNLLSLTGFSSMTVTEEEFYEAGMSDGITQGLTAIGVENINYEKEIVTFAGKEHVSALISGTYNGIPLYERLVLVKNGYYIAAVTAFSFNRQSVDDILGFFKPYSFS